MQRTLKMNALAAALSLALMGGMGTALALVNEAKRGGSGNAHAPSPQPMNVYCK